MTRALEEMMRTPWRGRFYIEHNDDGWCVVDSYHGLVLANDTRREAEQMATFSRAYVRKWGDINFDSFPFSVNEPLDKKY